MHFRAKNVKGFVTNFLVLIKSKSLLFFKRRKLNCIITLFKHRLVEIFVESFVVIRKDRYDLIGRKDCFIFQHVIFVIVFYRMKNFYVFFKLLLHLAL